MFPKQHLVLQNILAIKQLTAKHNLPLTTLEIIEQDAQQFVVRFPLIGAFSSGKSSLLNALLEQPIFAIDVTAETAVPAELVYANENSMIGHYADGRSIELSIDDVRENRLEMLQPNGWVEARFNAPALLNLPHLRLVDMPGWDSGIAAHTQAIDHYASRSLAYGIVVSADEGSLRDSIRNALVELVMLDMPIIAIISKIDKKPPSDIDEVAEQVKQEIHQATGHYPLSVVKVSGRRKNISEFITALADLENQTEVLFEQSVVARFNLELKRLARHLQTLCNQDDLNSEQITVQIEHLRLDIQAFDAKLATETQALDAQVAPVLTNISRRVENSLKISLDSLTNKALHNGDVSAEILTTARLAVTQGIREEFAPTLQRYFDRLAEAVPEALLLDAKLPEFENPTLGHEKTKSVLTTILATLLPVLTRHPIIAIAMPILHVLGELFIDQNAKRREIEERQENARQHILSSVIPDAVFRIEVELRQALHQQVQDAKNAITQGVRNQRQAREMALNELQAQLDQGQAQFAAVCAQYLADLATVENLLRQLEQD